MQRDDVTIPVGGDHCAAWLYRPAAMGDRDVPCVVMAHGFSLTRADGLAAYAEAFAAAGVAVLIIDHRHLGDSSGTPRQRFRVRRQREDWRAAVAYARTVRGVDPARIVLWGFSFACVHTLHLAAREPAGIAAVIAVAPFVDGLRRTLATPPATVAWIVPRALADAAGRHTTIPVTAPPGGRAAMTFAGECDGFARAIPDGSTWVNRISPAVFLTVGLHRPVRLAPRLRMPLWVGLGERDISVSGAQVEQLAERAPRGELHRYPYDHFDPFTGEGPARVAADQVAFLRRAGLAA